MAGGRDEPTASPARTAGFWGTAPSRFRAAPQRTEHGKKGRLLCQSTAKRASNPGAVNSFQCFSYSELGENAEALSTKLQIAKSIAKERKIDLGIVWNEHMRKLIRALKYNDILMVKQENCKRELECILIGPSMIYS